MLSSLSPQTRCSGRPKSDYEDYRRWLLETRLPDDISGRILEYSWHSMNSSLLTNLVN